MEWGWVSKSFYRLLDAIILSSEVRRCGYGLNSSYFYALIDC